MKDCIVTIIIAVYKWFSINNWQKTWFYSDHNPSPSLESKSKFEVKVESQSQFESQNFKFQRTWSDSIQLKPYIFMHQRKHF